jgi:hypothetical protein
MSSSHASGWRQRLRDAYEGPARRAAEKQAEQQAAQRHVERFLQEVAQPALREVERELYHLGAKAEVTLDFDSAVRRISVVVRKPDFHGDFRYSLNVGYGSGKLFAAPAVGNGHENTGAGGVIEPTGPDGSMTKEDVIEDFIAHYLRCADRWPDSRW